MRSRRTLIAVALCALAMGAAACGDDDDNDSTQTASDTDEPITIGFAIAESGPFQPFDEPPKLAAQQVIDEINADGGLLGREIRVVTADNKSTVEGSTLAGEEVLEKGADFMIVECDFDIGGPAARVAQEEGVVAFSSCAGDPKFGVHGIGPLAFTMGTVTPTEGSVAAEWAFESQGWERPYILQDTSIEYSKSQCDYFEQRWSELAGEESIAGSDTFQNDDPSITAQIRSIQQTDPPADFIYLCTYTPGGAGFVKQIRDAGIDLPIVSGIGMDGDYWIEATPDLSDFYLTAYASVKGDDPSEAVNDAVAEYEKRNGGPPAASFALTGAAIIEALQIAAERAGSVEGEALAEELQQFEEEELVVGPTTFTEEFHYALGRPMRILKFENGKLRFEELWEPTEVIEPQF
jgi:branched-chain amino acid transport system substrate-binding protein